MSSQSKDFDYLSTDSSELETVRGRAELNSEQLYAPGFQPEENTVHPLFQEPTRNLRSDEPLAEKLKSHREGMGSIHQYDLFSLIALYTGLALEVGVVTSSLVFSFVTDNFGYMISGFSGAAISGIAVLLLWANKMRKAASDDNKDIRDGF
jgi:hypothetical protein